MVIAIGQRVIRNACLERHVLHADSIALSHLKGSGAASAVIAILALIDARPVLHHIISFAQVASLHVRPAGIAITCFLALEVGRTLGKVCAVLRATKAAVVLFFLDVGGNMRVTVRLPRPHGAHGFWPVHQKHVVEALGTGTFLVWGILGHIALPRGRVEGLGTRLEKRKFHSSGRS